MRRSPGLGLDTELARQVQWALPEGISVWRVTLCAWDALLCRGP